MKVTVGIISQIKDYEKLKKLLSKINSKFDEIILAIRKDEKSFFESKKKELADNIKLIFYSDLDFSQIREQIRKAASNSWIFYLDSDEVPEKNLIAEIKGLSEDSPYDAFFIRRKEFFWKKAVKFGEVLKARKIGFVRLIKKNSKGKWQGKVHEEFKNFRRSKKLKGYLNHYSHSGIADFLRSIKQYSDLRVKEVKRRISFFELLLIPFLKFFYTYFILLGFLDGARGFVYSFMMSFYSFLFRAKLYSRQNLK